MDRMLSVFRARLPARGLVALLWLLASGAAAAAPALSAAFLSAGLSEALNRLAIAVDDPDLPPSFVRQTALDGSASFATTPPTLWSLELYGAAGDTGKPTLLFDQHEFPAPSVDTLTSGANGEASRLALTWKLAPGDAAPWFRVELASGDEQQPLAVGSYTNASASFTPGTALLDLLYAVDHCRAAERGFDIDAIEWQGTTLARMAVRFRCGAHFSGALRYRDIGALNGDVVRIKGRVWEDQDGNGLRDGDANGPDLALSNLRVYLLKDGRRVATTRTTDNGSYVFDAPYDTYQVAVEAPRGMQVTLRDVGADESLDSDLDPASGSSNALAPPPADFAYFGTNAGHRADVPEVTIGLTFAGGHPALPLASTAFGGALMSGDRVGYLTQDGKSLGWHTDTVLPGATVQDGSAVREVSDEAGNRLSLSNDVHGLRLHSARTTLANGRTFAFQFTPALVLHTHTKGIKQGRKL